MPGTSHPSARLLIHAQDDHPAGRLADSPMQRLRALYPSARPAGSAPLHLRIDTVAGDNVLSLDDAGPLVDVSLPAGTYHVTAHLGDAHRGYTMRLTPGEAFDLHLRLAQPGA